MAKGEPDGKIGTYRSKRHFAATPEPSGRIDKRSSGSVNNQTNHSAPTDLRPTEGRFVIQEHHARRLHWDLRLEHDGVLASWALPKGLPDDGRVNRKAIRTEDHPLEYIDFKGEIPSGHYGAGKVMIWDSGTYECHKWEENKVVFTLHGENVEGKFAVFKAGNSEKDWLLHLMWRPDADSYESMPQRIPPMLPLESSHLPFGEDWVFEIKWDGIRALTYLQPGELQILDREFRDITPIFPEFRELLKTIGARRVILDGVVLVFGDDSLPDKQRLDHRLSFQGSNIRRLAAAEPAHYIFFDCLYLDGHSLVSLPYIERRKTLDSLQLKDINWSTPNYHEGDGGELSRLVNNQGLTGLIAKRPDSLYESGQSSSNWVSC